MRGIIDFHYVGVGGEERRERKGGARTGEGGGIHT
jgi:hypothetical protein